MSYLNVEIDNRKIVIGILAIALLLFPVVTFTTGALRIALVLPFFLFFPGYTLLSALFPGRDDLDGLKRVAFSLGLSVAILPLIGLILNYTPWGIKLYPVLISTALFIVVTSAIGWNRQRKLPRADHLHFAFSIHLTNWAGMTKLTRTLSVSLIIAILVAISCLAYVITTPKQGEKLTEFYILGLGGRAEDYPREVSAGQPVYLTVVIVNHEYRPTSYRVEIEIRDETINQLTTGSLDHDQKWEKVINFAPRIPGEKQKVEFYLYTNDEVQPYFETPLHLYINVR